jgi:hypothetical protein
VAACDHVPSSYGFSSFPQNGRPIRSQDEGTRL